MTKESLLDELKIARAKPLYKGTDNSTNPKFKRPMLSARNTSPISISKLKALGLSKYKSDYDTFRRKLESGDFFEKKVENESLKELGIGSSESHTKFISEIMDVLASRSSKEVRNSMKMNSENKEFNYLAKFNLTAVSSFYQKHVQGQR